MSNEENFGDLKTVAETSTPDLEIPYDACVLEGHPDPCALVIIGASGDLTSRKLVPALYNLFLRGTLPDPFMTLSFLALPVIPSLKLTDKGLVDVDKFETVPLFGD